VGGDRFDQFSVVGFVLNVLVNRLFFLKFRF